MKVKKPKIAQPKWDFILKFKIPIPFKGKVKSKKPHISKGFIKRIFNNLRNNLKITL